MIYLMGQVQDPLCPSLLAVFRMGRRDLSALSAAAFSCSFFRAAFFAASSASSAKMSLPALLMRYLGAWCELLTPPLLPDQPYSRSVSDLVYDCQPANH